MGGFDFQGLLEIAKSIIPMIGQIVPIIGQIVGMFK